MADLVLVHSSGASARMWDPVRALLADRHRTLAPDLPGHAGQPAGLPQARHVVVPDMGHLWCLTAPERFSAMVSDFVESQPR